MADPNPDGTRPATHQNSGNTITATEAMINNTDRDGNFTVFDAITTTPKGKHNAYLVSEDDLESIELDEHEDIQLVTEDSPGDTTTPPDSVEHPPADEAQPSEVHFLTELSNSANFHANIGPSAFSDQPF